MNDQQFDELTLRDYWRVIVRRRWLIAVGVLVTVAGSMAMVAQQEPVYEAEAQMLVRSLPGDSVFITQNQSSANAERLILTEIQVLESEIVEARVRSNLGLTVAPPGVNGSSITDTDVVRVKVRSGDPTTARILADEYVRAYIDVKREQNVNGLLDASAEVQRKVTEIQKQIAELDDQVAQAPASQQAALRESLADQRQVLVDQQSLFKQRLDQLQVDASLQSGKAQLVRPADLPTNPVEPTPLRTALLALVVGLLLGLGAAFLVDYLDDSLKSPEELERISDGLPVLGVVPLDPPPDNRPITLSHPKDFAVETYRTLRTNVQFMGIDRRLSTIQVTSSIAGEGKTTTATNLALVMAQAGHSVVLVDADLRRPRVADAFALDGAVGLTDAYLGQPLSEVVQTVVFDDGKIDVLPAGRVPANPSEMLGGGRIKALLDELSASYDYVVIDSAPVLPVTDSVTLSTAVDAVVLVTQAGRTTNRQVGDTLSALGRVSAPVVGTVLNSVRVNRRGGYGYGYGYGYGSAYGSSAESETKSKRRKR